MVVALLLLPLLLLVLFLLHSVTRRESATDNAPAAIEAPAAPPASAPTAASTPASAVGLFVRHCGSAADVRVFRQRGATDALDPWVELDVACTPVDDATCLITSLDTMTGHARSVVWVDAVGASETSLHWVMTGAATEVALQCRPCRNLLEVVPGRGCPTEGTATVTPFASPGRRDAGASASVSWRAANVVDVPVDRCDVSIDIPGACVADIVTSAVSTNGARHHTVWTSRPRNVELLVIDAADGRPIAGAEVIPFAGDGAPLACGVDGRVSLALGQSGVAFARVRAEGYVSKDVVDREWTPNTVLTVRLRRIDGRFRVACRDADRACVGADVRVKVRDRMPVAGVGCDAVPGEPGTFDCPRVRGYVIAVDDGPRMSGWVPVPDVGDAEVTLPPADPVCFVLGDAANCEAALGHARRPVRDGEQVSLPLDGEIVGVRCGAYAWYDFADALRDARGCVRPLFERPGTLCTTSPTPCSAHALRPIWGDSQTFVGCAYDVPVGSWLVRCGRDEWTVDVEADASVMVGP